MVLALLEGLVFDLQGFDADGFVIVEESVGVAQGEVLERHRVGPKQLEVGVLVRRLSPCRFPVELLWLLGRQEDDVSCFPVDPARLQLEFRGALEEDLEPFELHIAESEDLQWVLLVLLLALGLLVWYFGGIEPPQRRVAFYGVLAKDLVYLVGTLDYQLGELLALLAPGELQDALVVLRVLHPDLVAILVRVWRLRSPR